MHHASCTIYIVPAKRRLLYNFKKALSRLKDTMKSISCIVLISFNALTVSVRLESSLTFMVL